ncbi:MAG: NUDIX hydrolase [Desulfatibacillaceae bacterium]
MIEGAGETPARDAASVIVARDRDGNLEVYLMRRAAGGFLGGFYVFPGGLVEDADLSEDLVPRIRLFETALQAFSGARGRGAVVAAIREAFEEAGLLYAENGSRGMEGLSGGQAAAHRERSRAMNTPMAEFCARHGLVLRGDRLLPWARWITPGTERRRYDTRFFLAPPPEGQVPEPDGVEMDRGVWLAPFRALELHARGDMPMLPPTVMLLHELAGERSLASLLDRAAGRVVHTTMPEPFALQGKGGVLLPNDPKYGNADLARPGSPGAASRLVWTDGFWTVCDGRFSRIPAGAGHGNG